jgi:hypothetical protein
VSSPDATPATVPPTTPRPPPSDTYLGDGLYARFADGMIELRAPRAFQEKSTDRVFLDPEVFEALLRFAERAYSVRITVEKGEPIT